MKKIIISGILVCAVSIMWMAFVRKPLPSVPVVSSVLSTEVPLHFSINTMNLTDIELGLNNAEAGKGLYVQFQMGNSFKTGRAGLVLKGMRAIPENKGGMKPDKYLTDTKRKGGSERDFSNFMKDKKGTAVTTYTFLQTLVQGTNGNTYMKMVYNGSEMEMIQILEIPNPVTLPAHISGLFVSKGIIQFQPGTVAFDAATAAFYIPVVIR